MSRLSTPEERVLALGKAFRRAWWPRFLAAIALASPLALTPTILFPGRADFVIAPVVFLTAALAFQWLFLRGRLRAALEAFSWIGRYDWLRARRALGDPFPTSSREARARIVSGELPPHPAAVDVLAAAGEYEAARRMVDDLPAGDAWERFERESQRDWVEWVLTGQGALGPSTEEAAEALRDPDERLRAEAVLALAAARERLAAGGDWKEPLVHVRERIGTRADGILRREWWRAQVVPTASVALGFAIVFALPT